MTKKQNFLGKYVDICTDFGMKHYFGPEIGKQNLINFLNGLFEGEKGIVDLDYQQTERNGEKGHERKVIFDLYCICDDGSHVIIEMQQFSQEFIKDRAVYYTSRVINALVPRGYKGNTYELPEVYLIGILDFVLDMPGARKYYYDIALCDKESGDQFYGKLGYKLLVLPNFDKPVADIQGLMDMWLYVFKHMSELNEIPKFLDKRVFQLIFDIGEVANLNPSDMNAYELSLKDKRDAEAIRLSMIRQLERGKKQALAEGMKEGMKEGLEKGILQGIEKGVAKERAKAKAEKLKSALNLKKKGVQTAVIAEGLGLSVEEIEELIRRGNNT